MKKNNRHCELRSTEAISVSGIASVFGLAMTAIIFFYHLSAPTSVHALTVTAIPPRLELAGNSGETLTAQLKVRNDSESLVNYSVSVEDFIVADRKGTPIPVIVPNSRWSLKQWISAPTFVPVDASVSQIVNISIRIPKGALPGGHFAMITYTPSDSLKAGEQKKTASAITQRVGTLLYVTVKGMVNESAMLSRFSIPQFNEFGPIDISGTVESISDVHLNPKGSVSIFNLLNQKVIDIPLETGNIFPNTSRDFSLIWNQKWGWGRYRADLNLVYGSAAKTITASSYFWFFPIRLVIYLLVILASVLTVITLLRHRARKHERELEKELLELRKELDRVVK